MTRTFTNSEGNAYEAVDNPYIKDGITIKPIKAVEKKTYQLGFKDYGQLWSEGEIYKEYDLTEPTAQKVAVAIEALMEYIQAEPEDVVSVAADIGGTVDNARAAFQEDV